MAEIILKVHVTPRGSKNEVIGWRENILWVKTTAPPVDGAANAAVVKLIASALGVRKKQVILSGGEKSREKTFIVSGISEEDLAELLK